MKRIIIAVLLIVTTISFGDYVLYKKSDGTIVTQAKSVAVMKKNVTGINWDVLGVGEGTVPPGATNTNQIPDFAVKVVADEEAGEEFDLKALKALAICINKRLGTNTITKAEFIAEYKGL